MPPPFRPRHRPMPQPGAPPAATGDALPHSTSPRASREDIYYCFRLILGRNPSPEEIPGHFAREGADLETVVACYLNSLEFSRRHLIGLPPDSAYRRVAIAGFEMYVDPHDEDVGKPVAHGGYEEHVTAVFQSRLRSGMRVVDLGANIGYFSMLAARLVGPSGAVAAFEPNPLNGRLIEANRKINGYGWVRLYQIAASDHAGTLMLNATFSNGTTADFADDVDEILRSTSVPCLRIDELLLPGPAVDFIKIDVEGAEYLALKGAAGLLARDRPVIVSEFSPTLMPTISGVSGAQYLDFLLELGYEFSVILGRDRLLECGRDTRAVLEAHERSGVDHIDFLATCSKR